MRLTLEFGMMPSMIKKMSDHVGVNKNIDHAVVADFGNEWKTFDQSALSDIERKLLLIPIFQSLHRRIKLNALILIRAAPPEYTLWGNGE